MSGWAIDLGTTNTGIARWDASDGRPRLLELPEICRKTADADPLEAPRLVPSATHVLGDLDFAARLGKRPFFARRFFLGKHAIVGRPATEMQEIRSSAAFAPGFKQQLEREPLRPLARAGGKSYTARDIARLFVRELFVEVKRVTGERIRDLVVTVPVDAYESYRAEVRDIAQYLGVRNLRFVDEPVASALGYGLGLQRPRVVLVIDIGGGTMHVAAVRISPKDVASGTGHVLGKQGRLLGGNVVDRWILRWACERTGYPLAEDTTDDATAFWNRQLLAESCRVKESLHFRESDRFQLTPPEDPRSVQVRLGGKPDHFEVTPQDLVDLLDRNGFYRALGESIDDALAEAARHGIGAAEIDDVLMVGGSSLLPGVYTRVEDRFGRDRVRAWQPFEATAYGGCAFAAGAFGQSDFIVHDYAFVTHDPKSHEPQYTVIVPKGTRFPSGPIWRRQLVPTCSLGEPETIFKLTVCEIGEAHGAEERRFAFDAAGNVHKLGGRDGGSDRVVVPLNESNPTLGYLDPPHPPGDRAARLEIAFEVNGDRWLCASVLDLKTRKHLMKTEPVVRLL